MVLVLALKKTRVYVTTDGLELLVLSQDAMVCSQILLLYAMVLVHVHCQTRVFVTKIGKEITALYLSVLVFWEILALYVAATVLVYQPTLVHAKMAGLVQCAKHQCALER